MLSHPKAPEYWHQTASHVISQNIFHGDALTMRTHDGQPITFVEWGYLGKGKFQRRDFRLDVLTGMSGFAEEGSLFAHLGKHEIFTPARTYPPMTMCETDKFTIAPISIAGPDAAAAWRFA